MKEGRGCPLLERGTEAKAILGDHGARWAAGHPSNPPQVRRNHNRTGVQKMRLDQILFPSFKVVYRNPSILGNFSCCLLCPQKLVKRYISTDEIFFPAALDGAASFVIRGSCLFVIRGSRKKITYFQSICQPSREFIKPKGQIFLLGVNDPK